ncbi:MAG: alpha/beta hydrolase [Verrucomicrobiales bacterium]|nr:alpha/beta hydrolase [Verrucomicrobiales bacterium]
MFPLSLRPILTACLLVPTTCLTAADAQAPAHVTIHEALVYATLPDGKGLRLDLTIPRRIEKPPVVMFIHGGGWHSGSRKGNRLAWLTEHGYATASISYRLSDEAKFPAQIHDCKAAARWLRDPANQEKYGYDATKLVVAGTSAGGHLSALMGTSGGVTELEGDFGSLEQTSRVDGVIDYYGPSDFILRSKNQPAKTEDPKGSVTLLLGGPVSANLELAALASPVTHVSKDDPPLLIFHGDADKTVYLDQSERLLSAYHELGLDATLQVVKGGGHGFKETPPNEHEQVLAFLKRVLGR